MTLKTVEEWEQHSTDLEKNEDLYGQGPVVGYEIDLAFKDNGHEGSWQEGTDFFRNRLIDWESPSSGTGFGLRDMQFTRSSPLTKDELNVLVEEAKKTGIVLEYLNQHGTNEWSEQSNEDTVYDFGYN